MPHNNLPSKYGDMYIDLYGLEATVDDLELRDNWALVGLCIELDGKWFGSIMVEFDDKAPDWLSIGRKIRVTENGIELIELGKRASLAFKPRIELHAN